MMSSVIKLFTKHRFFRLLELAYTGGALVLARLASILALIYAARLMEPKEYAGLIYAIGLSQIIVHLGSMGWLNLVRKESSRFELHSDALVKGFLRRSFQIPIALLTFLLTVVSILLYSGEIPTPVAKAVAYALILSAPLLVMQIFREYMVGYKKPVASIFLSETLPLSLMFIFFAVFKPNEMEGAIWCVFFGQIIGLIFQAYLILPRLKIANASFQVEYKTNEWMKLAALTVVGYGGRLLMDRMDTILIAPMVGMEQMAIFNSTSKIAAVMLLMSLVLIQFYSPHVAKAFKVNDNKSLNRIIYLQLIIITVAMIPVGVLLLLYPVDVMIFVFGARYQEGSNILWLSVLSNVMFAYALPFSSLLMMSDGEREYAIASLVGLIVYFVLCWFLIPSRGIVGASLGLLVATVLMSLFIIYSSMIRIKKINK